MQNNASQNQSTDLKSDSRDANRQPLPLNAHQARQPLHQTHLNKHPSNKSQANKNQEGMLTAEQAKFVYWFNGLFPILTSIVTPLTVYRKVSRKPNASDIQRYNDLLQEVSRQLVSGTIGLVSYFSGGALTKAVLSVLPSHHKDRDDRDASNAKSGNDHIKMIVGGSVLSFVGYSFIRPAIATDILYLLRKREAHDTGIVEVPKLARWQQKLQDTVDRQLMQDGKPHLKKTALLSFVVLGAYLNALAFSIYGLSRVMNALSRSTQTPDNMNSARQLRPTSSLMTPVPAPSVSTLPAPVQTGGFQRPTNSTLAYPRPGFAAYSCPLRTGN